MHRLLFITMSLLTASSYSFAQVVEEPKSRQEYVKVIDHFPLPSERESLRAFSKDKPYVLPAPLKDTFTLHSNPTATKVIYLDFDGHSIIWRGDDFHYVPFNMEDPDSSFSDTELTVIQLAWQSISEDFLPFNIDVTTEEPGIEALMNTGGGDTEWGIRAVISHNDGTSSWAYNDSFNSNEDTELYAWAGNFASVDETWIWIADSVSHEAGHSLGLSHDGTTTGVEYYEGHGKGETSWSPIMGWTNYGLSQWDKGEYTRSNNQEDDLSIITTGHGFDYRLDDHGSTVATATALDADDVDLPPVVEGIIEQTTDVDYFSFTVPSDGDCVITVTPDNLAPNLDIEANIYDS